MREGHEGVDSDAFCLIIPPNLASGAGSTSPLIVVVAEGDPGVPVSYTILRGSLPGPRSFVITSSSTLKQGNARLVTFVSIRSSVIYAYDE